jgi:cytochrome c biogenesis protein CcmG/thiol:disulfide interchange protein DsbE
MSAPAEHRGARFSPLALVPVAIFAGLGAAFYWGLFNGDDRLPSTLIDKPVPEFTLPPIEGRAEGLSTADLTGEVSIVNVWASWCVPCRVEMPLLVELAATDTVAIHGINYKDDPAAALAFLAELGNPYDRIGAKPS